MKKTILFGIILAFCIGIYGCGGSDMEESAKKPLISETALAQDTDAFVTDERTLVLNLEPHQSEANDGDLDEIGNDCFPFEPTSDMETTLMIDQKMPIDSIEITDTQSDDNNIFAKEDSEAIYRFQQGHRYNICVYHDDQVEYNQTITINFTSEPDSSSAVMATGCDFSGHDLSDCQFFPTASHTKCSATGTIITFFQCNLNGAKLNNTKIYVDTAYANFNNITVNNRTQFNLANNNVIHMKMENVDIASTEKFLLPDDIRGVSFKNSTLKDKIDFKAGIEIKDVTFDGADLSNVKMMDITFDNVSFKGTNFTQAILTDSDFTKSKSFNQTVFKDAFLNNADLAGMTIDNVNFSGATLSGVKFDKSAINNSTFNGCVVDENTTVQDASIKNIDLEQLSYLAKTDVDMSGTSQDVIVWNDKEQPAGYKNCALWNETSNTKDCSWYQEHIEGLASCTDAKYWKDNYLCSKEDIGLSFSNNGHHGENYVHLKESSDRRWEDNYLTYDRSTYPINFSWQSWGRIDKKLCINTYEHKDASNTWGDNFLCFDFD